MPATSMEDCEYRVGRKVLGCQALYGAYQDLGCQALNGGIKTWNARPSVEGIKTWNARPICIYKMEA